MSLVRHCRRTRLPTSAHRHAVVSRSRWAPRPARALGQRNLADCGSAREVNSSLERSSWATTSSRRKGAHELCITWLLVQTARQAFMRWDKNRWASATPSPDIPLRLRGLNAHFIRSSTGIEMLDLPRRRFGISTCPPGALVLVPSL